MRFQEHSSLSSQPLLAEDCTVGADHHQVVVADHIEEGTARKEVSAHPVIEEAVAAAVHTEEDIGHMEAFVPLEPVSMYLSEEELVQDLVDQVQHEVH